MRTLGFAFFLLLVGIVGVGFYRGWFQLSTNDTGDQPSATVTVDKDKIHADEQKAKDEMQSFRQETNEKTGDRAGKVKESELRP